MDINVILFDGFTALDFVGPAEVLHRIPKFQIRYYSVRAGSLLETRGKRKKKTPAVL